MIKNQFRLMKVVFFKSLQWRLVSLFFLLSLTLILPIGVVLNKKIQDTHYKDFVSGIDTGLKYWNLAQKQSPSSNEIIEEFTKNNNAFLFHITGDNRSYTIYDSVNSAVLVSSDPLFFEIGPERFSNDLLYSENFIRALAGRKGDIKKLIKVREREFFDYAVPINTSILYFRCYKEEWRATANEFNGFIIQILVFSMAGALVLGFFLSRTITQPVIRLKRKADQIASGNFGQISISDSNDEIGDLEKAFNYMAVNLKNTLAEISSEKNKIETILNHMTDGIIAYDMQGNVIHINSKARKLFDDPKCLNDFNQMARYFNVDICIEKIKNISNDKNDSEVLPYLPDRMIVEKTGKTLELQFALFMDDYKRPAGVVMVMHDVTQQHKLEHMRREFVANVSHELKTPLTSIKSYAETLLDGGMEDKETARRFLEVIDAEADRMTRLVRDLLQLSSIDNEQIKWNMTEVDIEKLVGLCIDKLSMEAEDKNQTIKIKTYCSPASVLGDADRLEQVILNILTNAIKYTPEGGKIESVISKRGDNIIISIIDNGIGIPKEDLPRIFERFYRVDKARSRQMGGTGLGLSIAREIILAHKGDININSEIGKGTEVVITLPAYVQ